MVDCVNDAGQEDAFLHVERDGIVSHSPVTAERIRYLSVSMVFEGIGYSSVSMVYERDATHVGMCGAARFRKHNKTPTLSRLDTACGARKRTSNYAADHTRVLSCCCGWRNPVARRSRPEARPLIERVNGLSHDA